MSGDVSYPAWSAATTAASPQVPRVRVFINGMKHLHVALDNRGNAVRTSMSVGSNTNGGFLVPTHLDPTIISSSSGWTNPLREISRVVTLTEGTTWNGLTNPRYSLAIKRLGTAVSSSFTGDMTQAVSDRILNRPVVEDDDAPSTVTTTALDPEIIIGDFSSS